VADSSENDPTSRTLGAVLRTTAASCGEEPALLSDKRSLSWKQLDEEVDRLAGYLVSIGVEPGDPVGFLITKRPEVVTGFLACARIGAVYSPINFKLHPDHIRDQFETANIKTVFTETQFDDLLKGVLPLLPDPRKIIYIEGPGKYGQSHYGEVADAAPLRNGPHVHPDSPCYYNYTSGTTGRPKGAVTTHRNILANGLATIQSLGFEKDDVFLGMFSVFAHPHELFHRSLMLGGPFVILDTLSPRIVAAAVERFGVTWMMAVPSFYEMMLDHHDADSGHDLSSLRNLEAGGAYVGGEALARLESRCAGRFLPVWGCTEATGVALANGPAERRDGATGRAVPGYEIRIVDDRGRTVEIGAVGEMILRGESVANGYIANPEETAKLYRDGWYHTQDLMRQDEDGWFHFVGRKSEMLKIGGIRVYPLEIEKVLKDHPEVRDVVVVRAEERVRGEVARAVVSTIAGSQIQVRTLQTYCRERLAAYKVPRIVEFWAEVPKMPNGKIDKVAVVAVEPDPCRDERHQADAV
jgi:long-chain acyl-CoA synthetase